MFFRDLKVVFCEPQGNGMQIDFVLSLKRIFAEPQRGYKSKFSESSKNVLPDTLNSNSLFVFRCQNS